jgi:uncharacterized protein
MEIKKLPWIQIGLYFFIAIILSGCFRFSIFDWYTNLSLPYGLTIIVKSILEGIGPIAGALVIFKLFKKKSSITLLGTQGSKSLIMLSLPILLFAFFGSHNDLNINPHVYGFIVGLSLVLYGIFEEFGWRGYLQNELKELKPLYKSLISGVLWYSWHLTFISPDTTLLNELKFFAIILFATWGIGAIAEKTKSVAASACFHILGNILFISTLVGSSIDQQTRYIIFGICLISWIYMVNIWENETVSSANVNPEEEAIDSREI